MLSRILNEESITGIEKKIRNIYVYSIEAMIDMCVYMLCVCVYAYFFFSLLIRVEFMFLIYCLYEFHKSSLWGSTNSLVDSRSKNEEINSVFE